MLIPVHKVVKVSKEKTAKIIPNAIGVTTAQQKHVFGSLLSRDLTWRLMHSIWRKVRGKNGIDEGEQVSGFNSLAFNSLFNYLRIYLSGAGWVIT